MTKLIERRIEIDTTWAAGEVGGLEKRLLEYLYIHPAFQDAVGAASQFRIYVQQGYGGVAVYIGYESPGTEKEKATREAKEARALTKRLAQETKERELLARLKAKYGRDG